MLWRHPELLWLALIVAALAALAAWGERRRRTTLHRAVDAHLLPRIAAAEGVRARRRRTALRLAALALLVVGLAGPRWGFHWERVRREGIDLIVAVDVSRSMLATDVRPNRLERARLAVLDLVRLLRGDRVGLVAFAGTAFLQCPLTVDVGAFAEAVRALSTDLIPRGGTALARAIEVALDGFEARQGRHQALVIISDGESHEGDLDGAVQKAKERGVRIFTIGMGSPEGELIPLPEGKGFLKDRHGNVVKSRLDEETLRRIALDTGGAYVRAGATDAGLQRLFRDHIARMERRRFEGSMARRYEDRFQLALAAALLLLALELWLPETTRPPRLRRLRRLAPAVVLVLAPALVGWPALRHGAAADGNRLYAQGRFAEAAARYREGLVDEPDSALLHFNLAAALYRMGEYEEAVQELKRVRELGGEPWQARAAYNMGNALFRMAEKAEDADPQAALHRYAEAMISFREAISRDPGNPDPKYGYELAAHRMQRLRERLEQERQEQQAQQQQQGPQAQQQQAQQEEQAGQEELGQQEQQEQQEQQDQEAGPGAPAQEAAAEQGAETPPPRGPQGETAGQDADAPEQGTPETGLAAGEPGAALPEGERTGGDLPPPAAAGEAAPEADGTAPNDRRAAHAVLDLAREEELDPAEVNRTLLGPAIEAGPQEDW